MTDRDAKDGASRLVLAIKGAYWVALLIIAAMATASYLFLQQRMAEDQGDQELLSLVSAEKALSQRVIFLANAASTADIKTRPPLVAALRQATGEFERNYDRLLREIGSGPSPDAKLDPDSTDSVLYGQPYHLDYFSVALAANSQRLISALESESRAGAPAHGYLAGGERARLDETVARATLGGYAALEQRIAARAHDRLERMVSSHLMLFYATIGVLILVAVFIFRPMAEMIERRTRDLVAARNSMQFIAIHDGLTSLYNRAFLVDHFDQLLRTADRRRERLAVLQLDLDRFKQINDTLGHAAGDYVLVKTAERMRASCRASDLCVRLGGDEFVMIFNGAGTTEDIAALGRRILDTINEPMDFGGATIHPGASGGIAVYPIDAQNAADLLVHADLALYSAKRLGGGAYAFFSDELRRELDHRKQLERDLKRAIEDRSFAVYYQPQISLADSSVAGIEALIRWPHPVRGMVPPGEFLPVAEKAGLMVAIGRIVMEKAMEEAADWYRRGIAFGRIALNVSGIELREADFADFFFATLNRVGLPPQKLSLEIVESVILDDERSGIAEKLRMIRGAGVHLELDDFGTGYASLSHVNPNEIDRLKIDRRFVQKINENTDNTKIVRAITELARGLGISIIAEGAETEEELSSLLAIGCEHVQGYSIAFPMPGSQTQEWLAQRSARRPKLMLVESLQA